jgi:hypothetical protein
MSPGEFGIHRSVAEALTSDEAEEVTPHMCAIYYRLILAPESWWEKKEYLLIKSKTEDSVLTPAWSALVAHLRVPPQTARRALEWMEEKGFINVTSSADGREIRISLEGLYFPKDKPQD